jgi:hypothetical protein
MSILDAIEAPTAYLFQCRNDSGLYAVSLERNAGNIPLSTAWYAGWKLRRELALGAEGPASTGIDATPILRGLRSAGYYIWRNGLA